MWQNDFLTKLNVLVGCTPENCTGVNCPLYYEEKNCCDAARYISLFSSAMKEKLKNVKTYDPFSEEDIV